ncbi:MAG: PspC domain-containing protein [Bacteroides sp.]|nr:PspC domain-containing protein [Bacteroides sp.]
MIQTLNINLGGRLFVIDSNAYDMLHEYTETLRHVFIDRANDPEVVSDIESRLSELLSESIVSTGKPSVDLNMVSEAIQRVGRPEDFLELETEEHTLPDGEKIETINGEIKEEPALSAPAVETRKRFFRDPQDKMIGGVCSGLAAYFHTDPTWIRIAMVILAFCSMSTVAIIYLILCCVVPEARTPLERMQMSGETPTLNNIARSVTDLFRSNSKGSSSAPAPAVLPETPPYLPESPEREKGGFARFLSHFFAVIGWIFLTILLIIALPVGLACVLGIIGLLIALLIYAVAGWIPGIALAIQGSSISPILCEMELMPVLCALSCLITILIPCGALIWGVLRASRHQQAFTWGQFILMFCIWIICASISGYMIALVGA